MGEWISNRNSVSLCSGPLPYFLSRCLCLMSFSTNLENAHLYLKELLATMHHSNGNKLGFDGQKKLGSLSFDMLLWYRFCIHFWNHYNSESLMILNFFYLEVHYYILLVSKYLYFKGSLHCSTNCPFVGFFLGCLMSIRCIMKIFWSFMPFSSEKYSWRTTFKIIVPLGPFCHLGKKSL